ncbi:4Fe-4S binding protein [Gordonibacter sp. 28C]|uniref:4Fe-4S binding protein n=1 Tax=Gordonibacter sp. 28C TaxID=2078569 RepID=UPI000DF7F803|nr:4Fe-4S binding protein [Gordonibacter sp. 28C]
MSTQEPARRAAHIPVLRSGALDPQDFAHATCFEAGYLTMTNAGWRNVRPVVDLAACTGCLQCYMYCPDGTVYKVPAASRPPEPADAAASPGTRSRGDAEGSRTEVRFASAIPTISGTGETLADPLRQPARSLKQPATRVAIDYDFCKGCGICAKMCAFGAIAMVSEKEALAAEAAHDGEGGDVR